MNIIKTFVDAQGKVVDMVEITQVNQDGSLGNQIMLRRRPDSLWRPRRTESIEKFLKGHPYAMNQ